MPPPMLWRSRGPLYKVALIALLAITPFNILSVVLPFWLEVEGKVALGDPDQATSRKERLHYGIWELCSDSLGCSWVHNTNSDAGVGFWLYFVELFMMISLLLHVLAAVCGALQNFLSRDISRRWTSSFLKMMVHRDCALTEDIGFVAGFFGQVASIVFMLCTKEKVSAGASYSWSFAIGFMATSMAVLSSVTLTKAHTITVPRPNVRSRSRPQSHQPDQPEPGRELAESAPRRETGERESRLRQGDSELRRLQGESEFWGLQGESETRLGQGESETRLGQGESESRRGQRESECEREPSDSAFRRLHGEPALRGKPGNALPQRGHRDSASRTELGDAGSPGEQGQSAPRRGQGGDSAYRREQGDDRSWRTLGDNAYPREQRDDTIARGEEYSAYWREQGNEARSREGEVHHRAKSERTHTGGEGPARLADSEQVRRQEGGRREGHRSSALARQPKSRSRSRSKERRSSSSKSRRQNSNSFANESRLVRSRELENIPAAVAPSYPAARAPAPAASRQRSVETTDLQRRAASPLDAAAASEATGHVSAPAAKGDSDRSGSSSTVSRPSNSSSSSREERCSPQSSGPTTPYRTVIDVSVKLPLGGSDSSVSGDNSKFAGTRDSNCGGASGITAPETTKL